MSGWMGIVNTAMPFGQGQNLRVAPKDDLAGAGMREAGFGRPDLDTGGIPELAADGRGSVLLQRRGRLFRRHTASRKTAPASG